jgi:hypothetical protein
MPPVADVRVNTLNAMTQVPTLSGQHEKELTRIAADSSTTKYPSLWHWAGQVMIEASYLSISAVGAGNPQPGAFRHVCTCSPRANGAVKIYG